LLILLIDKRVAGLEATLRSDGYDPMEHLDTKFESEAYSLPEKDILQALLLVVDSEKKVVYSEELGRESARLDRVFLYRDKAKPTFIITTDYSIGAGSYNGPISRLLEVTEKGIVYLLPDNTGLMNSLKAAWATVDGNGSKDIIFKSCHPDYDANRIQMDRPTFWWFMVGFDLMVKRGRRLHILNRDFGRTTSLAVD
jgi:hypothetical protein